MRFGPGLAPEKVTRILKEAFAIKPGLKVGVTEFGCDGMIQRDGWPDFRLDNEAQAKYIQDFTEHAQQYCESTGHKLSELYCWTAQRRQLEWENGADCKLGILEAIVNTARQLIGWGATPASCYLASMYKDESADTQNTISA